MIKLTGRSIPGSSLWFVIPQELQNATKLMLQAKINEMPAADARDYAEGIMHDVGNNPDEKYSESIWEVHGLAFYAKYGSWRVGCAGVPKGFTEESILAEIANFDAIDVESRVVPDTLLIK